MAEKLKLTRVQRDVLGLAVDRGMVDYYQAAEAGAQGQTLESLVRKGLLSEFIFANGVRWLPTDSSRLALENTDDR